MSAPLGTLAELAARTGGRVVGDPSIAIERITAVDDADATTLTFAVDERYLRVALGSRAAAVLTDTALVDANASYPKPILAVDSTRIALAGLLAALEPVRPRGPFRHPSAAVDDGAEIGADVWIGAHVTVAAGARIGARTVLDAGVTVGSEAVVGADCLFHPRAYVAQRCIVGDRVVGPGTNTSSTTAAMLAGASGDPLSAMSPFSSFLPPMST